MNKYAVNEFIYKNWNARILKFTSVITWKIRYKACQSIWPRLYDKAFNSESEAKEHITYWCLWNYPRY